MKLRPIAEVALELCREEGENNVWYGGSHILHEIYCRSGRTQAKHPINVRATVISCLARSDKWRLTGYITHLGRKYPVYTPDDSSDPLSAEARHE